MQKNLFDFANQNKQEEKLKTNLFSNSSFEQQNNTQSQNKATTLEEQAKQVYEKYQNYSQDELMNEFLQTSKQKLKDGLLTQEKLQNTVNSLSPFLNNTQKEFLKGLIDKLND